MIWLVKKEKKNLLIIIIVPTREIKLYNRVNNFSYMKPVVV